MGLPEKYGFSPKKGVFFLKNDRKCLRKGLNSQNSSSENRANLPPANGLKAGVEQERLAASARNFMMRLLCPLSASGLQQDQSSCTQRQSRQVAFSSRKSHL
jgi:hypothetical protein